MAAFDPPTPGELGLGARPLRLAPLVQSSVDALRAAFPNDVEVESRVSAEDAVVAAEPAELLQVLIALGHDARASIAEGKGSVSIRLDREPLPVGMVVSNIAESYFAVVFTVKRPSSEAANRDRSALLDRARAFAERHGGFLDLGPDGPVQRAALVLPESPPVEAAALSAASNSVPSGAPLVLLAEDEPTVAKIATRILTRAGYRVLHARDGREALALFRAHADEVQLAILDAMMPGLTGEEVYAHINQLRPGLPVLFSSGYNQDSWPPGLLEQDGVGVLPKPYDPPTLLSALQKLLPLH